MHLNTQSCYALLTGLLASILILFASGPAAAETATACDVVADAKNEFVTLRRQFAAGETPVDEATFRDIANDYVSIAELCYHETYGGAADTGASIDDGGMLMPSSGSGPVSDDYVLWGGKWGAGSPFAGPGSFPDIPGPRIPGGTVTYSFMPAGVSFAAEVPAPPDTNTPITGLATFDGCFLEEVENALGAWSAVADITFVPVTDGGGAFNTDPMADIRIGAHTIDGASGTLAHAFFPPPNGLFAAGDTHFDIAEPWACDPTLGAIDFGIVALHEFGHAIGLRHEPTQIALMNAFYNPALTFGPLADDTIAVGEIYGAAGAATTVFNPNVGIGTDTPDSSLHVQDNKTGFPQLLHLENLGSDFAGFRFTTTGGAIDFNKAGSNTFRLNVVDGDTWELELDPDGNLTVKGDVFSSTCAIGNPCAPDYVFAPGYKLMPLDDLEAFIKRENHLPNVPSAEELVGPISLNNMQMRLLEKVEELTLYTLEQQKTIEDLESRLEAMER